MEHQVLYTRLFCQELPATLPSCRWARLRGFVVTGLVNLVSCSSSTRAKLWAASGLDVFLHLLAEQVAGLGGQAGACPKQRSRMLHSACPAAPFIVVPVKSLHLACFPCFKASLDTPHACYLNTFGILPPAVIPQESVELGALSALDVWLSEDHSRLEARLTQRDPIAQLVGLYARIAQVGCNTPCRA
jgi:hypothetical protein